MSTLSFFDPSDIESGFLSNFYRSEVKLDGTIWPTVEHYYQAQKFQDAAQVERIRQASTPRHAKNLGQARDVTLREDWGTHRMTAMLRALTAKFTQHVLLQQKLMMTGDAILVEASPHDSFWGDGPDGHGENRLGYLLTSLRDQLRMAQALVDGISADHEALAQQCFEAVGTLHVTWWLPDSLRTEAQTGVLPDQLHAYVRDVDLPDGYLGRYRTGLIFREPTFCDVSEHSTQGLAAKHRYFLLSGNARYVDSFFGGMSGSPGTGLCMFAPDTLWNDRAHFVALAHLRAVLQDFAVWWQTQTEWSISSRSRQGPAPGMWKAVGDLCALQILLGFQQTFQTAYGGWLDHDGEEYGSAWCRFDGAAAYADLVQRLGAGITDWLRWMAWTCWYDLVAPESGGFMLRPRHAGRRCVVRTWHGSNSMKSSWIEV